MEMYIFVLCFSLTAYISVWDDIWHALIAHLTYLKRGFDWKARI